MNRYKYFSIFIEEDAYIVINDLLLTAADRFLLNLRSFISWLAIVLIVLIVLISITSTYQKL